MSLLAEELIDLFESALFDVRSEGFFVFETIQVEVASSEFEVPAGLR